MLKNVLVTLLLLLALVVVSAACETSSETPSNCTDWCQKMTSACSDGDTLQTCTESCNHAGGVNTAAMSCANAAQSCADTSACWGLLFPQPADTSNGSVSG